MYVFNFANNIYIIRHPGGLVNDSCCMNYWGSFPDRANSSQAAIRSTTEAFSPVGKGTEAP
jgi:hypothetical protein